MQLYTKKCHVTDTKFKKPNKTQKNPIKPNKTQKNPKKPTGLGFFKKTRVFSNPALKGLSTSLSWL
jgi:hypothetical protein